MISIDQIRKTKNMKKKIFLGLMAAAAITVLILSSFIFHNVDNKEIVANQFPVTGTMVYWTDAGLKMQMFGKTTVYNKTDQIWFSKKKSEGGGSDTSIPIRFYEGGNGHISGSFRIKLALSPKYMEKIHTDFAGMENVINDLIMPSINKVVYASGSLLTSFESYAEKRNDLTFYIEDQLVNGIYKTRVVEVKIKDLLTNEDKVVKMSQLIQDSTAINGYARQIDSPFKQYGIEISQLSISDITYDDKVNAQIAQQQEANMSIQTAVARSLAAQQKEIEEEANGKAAAMKAKWEQEKIKIVAVTKAQQEFEVAEYQAKQAKEVAEKILTEGKAQAESNRLKVQAGLTPLEAAEWKYKTQVGIAEKLSQSKQPLVPQIMINGGDNKGGSDPMQAVGLNMLLDLTKKMSKEEK